MQLIETPESSVVFVIVAHQLTHVQARGYGILATIATLAERFA